MPYQKTEALNLQNRFDLVLPRHLTQIHTPQFMLLKIIYNRRKLQFLVVPKRHMPQMFPLLTSK